MAYQQAQKNQMRTSRLAENGYDRGNYNNFDYRPGQQNNYHSINRGEPGGQDYRYSVDSRNNYYQDVENSERANMRYQ